MKLCDNCLEPGNLESAHPIQDVPVGKDIGSQRDPERRKVALCGLCADALTAGDWRTIHERYSETNTILRDQG